MVRVIVAIALILTSAVVQAQLSPGELHATHAFLEGVQSCSKCHGGDDELVPENCLACHQRIDTQRRSGSGLHSRSEFQLCQNCHVEHQGRDFDLIHWKGSEKNFDHSPTGFSLKEKHASLDCRQCHQAKYISQLQLGPQEKVDSARTYLGLSANCVTCHRDEHRAQLGNDCTKCHNQTAWKPAGGFDHATTRFTLMGKHATVDCAKCHRLMTDLPLGEDVDYMKMTNLEFGQCSACHVDPHNNRLGSDCRSCHSTEGWFQVSTASFDHRKTRYPLEGKHVSIACDGCHKAGQSRREMKFAACLDCHSDYHRKQFAARTSKGACEECHTVGGFSPARFLMSQHEQTDYPLRGAHQAVPCLACHNPTGSKASADLNFSFASAQCQVCHKDPHRGQVVKLVAAEGCESCHAVEDWNKVTYDHSRSNFALEGKHVRVACGKCHADVAMAGSRSAIKFTGIRTDCQSCHSDVHRSQFVQDGDKTDCSRCHTSSDWKVTKFNHASSRFKLDGAHQRVPCNRCHTVLAVEGGNFVRYKPTDTACAACHSTTPPQRSS